MKYISSALFLLSTALTANCLCGTEWTTGIANPFICRLFQNAASAMKGEFIEIYSGGMNLTKEELNDKLQQWAIKQGSETEDAFRKFLVDEADYWNTRYEVLMKRIKESNATAKAKEELIEVVNFEQDMDVKFNEYERKLNTIREKYPKEVDEEAVEIWNSIDTPDMQ